MGSKVIAVGLFAAWAVHDLEEIVGTRYWRRKAIPRLRARYPTVPDAVWRTAEVLAAGGTVAARSCRS